MIAGKSNWEHKTLRELGEFRNGVNFSKEDKGAGLKLINVKDIFQSGIVLDFSRLDCVNLSDIRNIERYFVRKNDIFIVRSSVKREGIGLVSISKKSDLETVHCGFVIRFRPQGNGFNPLFLAYLLRSPQYRPAIINLSSGAAITNISQDSLGRLIVALPSLAEQDSIVRILSAYDDLIENNTRRIQILEEMARRIYDEWFVRFRFPGHENIGMAESEHGLIPNGWKVQWITQMIGFDPRTKVPREGLKPFIPMSSLAENSMLITNIESRAGNSGSKFKNGDTILARITPCLENGKTGFVDFLPDDNAVAFGSTEYIVLRSKTVTPEFVYLTARSDRFRQHAIKSMSGATGRQRVRVDSFNEYMLAQPTKDTLDKFSELVSPAFKTIGCLAKKSANLRRTRDLLLPKLISGEIDVSNFHEPVTD